MADFVFFIINHWFQGSQPAAFFFRRLQVFGQAEDNDLAEPVAQTVAVMLPVDSKSGQICRNRQAFLRFHSADSSVRHFDFQKASCRVNRQFDVFIPHCIFLSVTVFRYSKHKAGNILLSPANKTNICLKEHGSWQKDHFSDYSTL